MRDGQIMQMRDNELRRFTVMARQLLFIQTRIEAYEEVLSKRWNVLRGTFSPSWLTKQIDTVQLRYLKEHDEQVKKVEEQAKEDRMKSRLNTMSPNGR